jgi:HEAT repeat protein
VTALSALLEDREPAVRLAAAVSLWRLGRKDRALPVFRAALRGTDTGSIYRAIYAAQDLGRDARELVPLLVQLAKSDEHSLREAALAALRKIDLEAAVKAARR